MFVFFCWDKKMRKEYGNTYPLNCPNCQNKKFAHLVNIKTWFTFFFIPIIPYESKYYLLCNICQRGIKLSKEQIKKAKSINIKTKAFISNAITEEEYEIALDKVALFR